MHNGRARASSSRDSYHGRASSRNLFSSTCWRARRGMGAKRTCTLYYTSTSRPRRRIWRGFRFKRPAFVHPLSPARNVIYANMREFADVIVSVKDETAVVDKDRTAPAATLASHVARRVGRRPDVDTRRRRRPHRAHGPRRRRGVARDVLVVVLTRLLLAKGARGRRRAAPLYRRPTCIPRARGGGSPHPGSRRPRPRRQAVAQPRSDGVGADGLSRYVLR